MSLQVDPLRLKPCALSLFKTFAKLHETNNSVIPAKAGSGPGQAPESTTTVIPAEAGIQSV